MPRKPKPPKSWIQTDEVPPVTSGGDLEYDAMLMVDCPGEDPDIWACVRAGGEWVRGGGPPNLVRRAITRVQALFLRGKELPVRVERR